MHVASIVGRIVYASQDVLLSHEVQCNLILDLGAQVVSGVRGKYSQFASRLKVDLFVYAECAYKI
jgi:hypothetical protein